MKQEDTRRRILDEALRLFSERGYDAVSVGEIARAVGIKAPSLYNHFSGKRAIFDAMVEDTAERYARGAVGLDVHLENAVSDESAFTGISEDALAERVKALFLFSLHDESTSRFRRLLTIEQFRSPELSELYTRRCVERLTHYHAELFARLISSGELMRGDAEAMALMYTAPILTLAGICDRQPEREAECLDLLDKHIRLFFRTFGGEKQRREEKR